MAEVTREKKKKKKRTEGMAVYLDKGITEDEMVGWRHQLNGHESEQAPKDTETCVLQSMGSQRVEHDRRTEQQQQMAV